ncbi:hypothetical protein LJC55_03295 [Eubacteriales bacterium OttesenSCG-928-N14]|nr:hypothetical protein [Eubacteriales bacterium OttesenSCG-928-N14]
MTKTASRIFCAIFFVLILTPLVLLPLADNTPTENRPLAQLPALSVDGSFNLQFPAQMEDYFQDHFFGRSQMIDIYGRFIGNVFSTSANEKVVWGKEGWLYFGETVADYEGSAAMTEAQMNRLAISLKLLHKTIQQRDQQLIIAIAPNKNSIYPQYMPASYYRSAQQSNYDRLMQLQGLHLIDLKAAFLQQEDILYYQTDTHWNATGARLAARIIMQKIQQLTGIDTAFDWDGVTPQPTDITGDLAKMLFPADTPTEADLYYADTQKNYQTSGGYRVPDDMRITTTSNGADLSIYILRDSFTNYLIDYFSNGYASVHYTRQMPMQFESEFCRQANIILLQMVERRLDELLIAAPHIYAPAADAFDITNAQEGLFVHSEKDGNGRRIWGYAPAVVNHLDGLTVMLKSADSQAAYEAFPILEQQRYEATGNVPTEQMHEAAFSLLVEDLPPGQYEVYLLQQGDTNAVYAGNFHF